MKNIFNHNKGTSLLTSSLRAKRGNLYTSIRSLYLAQSSRLKAHGVFFPKLSTINYKLSTLSLAQGSRHKASLFRPRRTVYGMLALLFFSVMLIQSGCSLTADRYIERYLGNNSVCWEDNDHILIYASIAQYWYNQDVIGGPSKEYDWVGGEIWRITASTGVKELLFREKGDKYWAWDNTTGMRINDINGNIYICDVLFTYKVRDDFSEWDSIGYFTLPIISEDEKTVVAYDTEEYSTVKKYNLENNTSEDLYVNDELITWLDYDYERNYLLINSNKFVDLNTGEEVKLIEDGDIFNEHYSVDERYINTGEIVDNRIFVNIMKVRDEETMEVIDGGKAFIEIDNWDRRNLSFGIFGVLSPNRDKYAVPGLFTDTIGDTISQWSIPFDEL